MQEEPRPAAPIRVLVASTDKHLRSLLCWSLAQDDRLDVVAQVSDGDAIVMAPAAMDVALVDMSINGLGILGVLRRLGRRDPVPNVVVVSTHDVEYLRHALDAEGATDYLVMPRDVEQLTERLWQAAAEQPTYAPAGGR
jgi:DNA-binding NarL/FixJ family response regulator